VEDVQAATHPGGNRPWKRSFSPLQCGKEHLYRLLSCLKLKLHLREGRQIKAAVAFRTWLVSG
jgi:hypothetical protein